MKLLTAFLRLIRWPNLVFIVVTQVLFYYCIIVPSLPGSYYLLDDKLTQPLFFGLVTASVLIAAAGYIINDYFDINIDQVNKPGKMIVEKIISRRWAIALHFILSTIGVAISLYVSLKTSGVVIVGNIICTILLWVYSTTFKKKLLSGNVIISTLTAWTVVVLYFATNTTYYFTTVIDHSIFLAMQHIYKLAALYAGFAFIASLIREAVKDIEDREGDRRYDCKTMPIVWGVQVAKVYTGVWLIVLAGALTIIVFYLLQLGWWLSALYCVLLIILPVIWILRKLSSAQSIMDYHQLSTAIKLLMLTGIVSMIFLKF